MQIKCEKTAQLKGEHLPTSPNVDLGLMQFSFASTASDPCVSGAPDIDMNGLVTINTTLRSVKFSGMIEPFPSFEAYVMIDGGAAQKLFTHGISSGKTAWSLFGAANVPVDGEVTF